MISEIQRRARQIGLDIIHISELLPNTPVYWVIQKQLIRSSTSVGANYRAVSRAKSPADFIHKLTIVEEEADETLYWLDMLLDINQDEKIKEKLEKTRTEANEILSIVVASIRTAKSKQNQK